MKKILFYISMEKHTSPFDIVEAYDAVEDVAVVPYTNVSVEEIPALVNDIIFPRNPKDLINTAIFIGGHDVVKGDEMMEIAVKQMFNPFRVSIVADTDGSNTTAAGCAYKIKETYTKKGENLKGQKAIVFAGTGPVGLRIATLLIKEGVDVAVTSRKLDRAIEAIDKVRKVYNADIKAYEVRSDEDTIKVIEEFKPNIIVTTGPPKITLVSKAIWSKYDFVKILTDVNAYPPYGIEGVDANDDCKEIEGRTGIGALRIGTIKNKAQKAIIRKLFEKKGNILKLEDIYAAAFE
ncbi:MAG: hypothetical protein BWK75_00775 [Candidatus Altiarchaeales archaeon A3]|nr:MAG: hypothetical protein BWK75_00775 [Candidatus Altiarchaeales archaeon A3]